MPEPPRLREAAAEWPPPIEEWSEPGRQNPRAPRPTGRRAETGRLPPTRGSLPEPRPDTPAPPAIEITIGRLEIRGEPAAAPRPGKPFQPHLDLAAYRAARERGNRERGQ
jgi:hypothetical protein